MSKHKDKNDNIHDDDDGKALSLASWPKGLVLISDDEAEAIQTAKAQASLDALTWEEKRVVEYAKRNQDEMRYDDIKNNTNTWVDWQDQIRLDIPKPL